MQRVGFMCRFEPGERRRSPFLVHRALPMATVLRDFGTELFIYSPRHVLRDTGEVEGYVVRDGRYEPARSTVPWVNGDWVIGTSRQTPAGAMTRQEFRRWTRGQRIDIYPNRRFQLLTSDKLRTFEMLERIDPGVHPYTEACDGSIDQIERFLYTHPLAFMKPTSGARGDDIVAIRRTALGYELEFHRAGTVERRRCDAIHEVARILETTRTGERRIVQAGIAGPRIDGAPFTVRVLMASDGERWHWLAKAHVAPDERLVANISQGGHNDHLQVVLERVYGAERAPVLSDRLRETAFRVTAGLDDRYGGIMELAYDVAFDADERPRILEVNTKPGLSLPGLPHGGGFKDPFRLSRRDRRIYGRRVVPYATHLAHFLQRRLDERRAAAGRHRPPIVALGADGGLTVVRGTAPTPRAARSGR